ncbi:MAG: DNA polymerase III subunit chi [Verrucomicrobiota bacterium]|nr:DNA polymerase III subunit chi [Verrucomicrobiota bacterium]
MRNSDAPSTRAVFFQTREAKTKTLRLLEIAATHFERKEHLLILVEDEKAMDYVDELLWKSPPTSFLPHIATNGPTTELIAITRTKQNINQARSAFNLCSTPLLIEGPFRLIYDFEDLTSPGKQQLSALRFDAYKKAGFLIEAR